MSKQIGSIRMILYYLSDYKYDLIDCIVCLFADLHPIQFVCIKLLILVLLVLL